MPHGRDIYSLDPTIPQLRGTHQTVAPKVLSILSKVFRGEDSLTPEMVHIGEKEQAVKVTSLRQRNPCLNGSVFYLLLESLDRTRHGGEGSVEGSSWLSWSRS